MNEVLRKSALIFLGGGLGANLRYWFGGWVQTRLGPEFPYGTLVVNATGSFVLGFVMGAALRTDLAPNWRLFLAVGVLGGYTTFSTFSYETLQLVRDGSTTAAALNVVGTLALALTMSFLGAILSRAVT